MAITHFTCHAMIYVNYGCTMLLRKALKVLTRSQKGLFQSNQSLPLKDGLTTINGTSKTSKRIIDTVGVA